MELVPEFYVNDLRVDDYPFSVIRGEGGLDLGNPESITQVIDSMVIGGPILESTGTTGRAMVLPLLVEGADLLELAQNEATLILACSSDRNTFTLDPGDGYAPATVFDTFKIDAKHTRDDKYEAALVRRWDLVIPASSWGRSPVAVTQTFEPVSTSVVVVDAATSLTNWDDYIDSTVVALSTETYLGEGVIKARFTAASLGAKAFTIRWFGTEPSTDYVSIDVNWDGSPSTNRVVYMRYAAAGGILPDTTLEPVAVESVTHGAGTYVRYYFERPLTTVSGYWFKFNEQAQGFGTYDMRIANLASSDTTGSGGVQTVATIGSVRAPGSITCTRTTDMACLFIYSDPILASGFSPAVKPTWGSAPDGTYIVYAESWGLTGEVVSLTFTDAAGRTSTATTRITAREAGLTWQPIGEVSLGGFRSGLIGTQTIVAKVNGTPETAPDLRLFRKHDDAALTYIDDIAANTIEMATPSVDLPRGGLWADDVACFDKALTGAVFPTIVTPLTAIYMESDGADPVHSVLSYYPRSHTYNSYVPL